MVRRITAAAGAPDEPPAGPPVEPLVAPVASSVLLPELGELVGHVLWRAHARVVVALADVLPPGIDIHAYAALLALAGGATRSQQDLARATSVSRTTMVRVAADLAADGLVERVRNPEDRRSYALTRTEAGAAALNEWHAHALEVEDALCAGFGDAERAELLDLLRRAGSADLATDTPQTLLDSIGFLVSRIHLVKHRHFIEALAPLRIEPRHFGSLVALSVTGPVAQTELARLIGLSPASVVEIVDDLSARGLVERRRLETDRRTQVLHLLPGAEEVVAQAHEIAAHTIQRRLAPLTATQTRRLAELLRTLVTTP